MEYWERELLCYADRLAQIEIWAPDLLPFVVQLPEIPLRYSPSPKGLVALNLSLYALNCLRVADQSRKAFLTLWSEHLFEVISLPARFLFELWGGSHYALQVLCKMEKSGDANKAQEQARRLLLGARSDVTLPWGEPTLIKSVNVMEFVRALSDVFPEAENVYAFLCESCHPSFLRLMYWSLMSPPLDNWTNPKFGEEAHFLLDRTLQAVERSLEGILADTTSILRISLPYVKQDQSLA